MRVDAVGGACFVEGEEYVDPRDDMGVGGVFEMKVEKGCAGGLGVGGAEGGAVGQGVGDRFDLVFGGGDEF